ncbi:MFS transporter [Nitratireductor sp. XY-223]|uniref:MFS transporter n=1 Tax=Nitratireductor sp. XY-223 TaxID=2561926 RepID=UPI001FEE5243|nr:MFS transporter [Nitratireductor sp. XY-223]
MAVRPDRQSSLILALVFIGGLSASSLVPMMSLFIVEGLGREPWHVSLYSGIVIALTMLVNRIFGERIDRGTNIARLLLVSILCFLVGTTGLALIQSYVLLISGGALFLGLSNAALSTTFTYGRLHAEKAGLDTTIFNSWLRIAASLAWMIGPALSFTVIGVWGFRTTFLVSAALGCLWLVVWHFAVPKDFLSPPRQAKTEKGGLGSDRLLLVAAAACVFFSLTNSLYIMAMPLFFVQEVGLPYYAPGLSFSTKCFVEVPAIFAAGLLAKRIGERNVLYIAAIIAVATFLAISEIRTVPQMIAIAAFEGLYYGLFAGVGITFVQSFAGGRTGRATSMYVNSLFLGGAIGGISMGFVATGFDYRTVVFVSAGCAFCALLTLFATRGADSRRDPAVADTN